MLQQKKKKEQALKRAAIVTDPDPEPEPEPEPEAEVDPIPASVVMGEDSNTSKWKELKNQLYPIFQFHLAT